MEFTIVGRDQGSQVITSINKKINEFGKDVGKSIVGFLGPMALATMAISKISDYLEGVKQKAKEAFDWGASLNDAAAKLGVNAEEFQRISSAADATGESVDKVAQAFKLASDLITRAKAGNADAIASLTALGISVDDLGKTKPEDVLARLAGAMAAGKDPTEKMAIAMAALGTSAKDLQAVLAKGFDIQGAMLDTEGLTQDEANLLRERAKNERAKANREKVASARQAAREEFMATAEGKAFVQKKIESGTDVTAGAYGARTVTSAAIDAEIARLGKEKRDKEAAIAEARAKAGAPAAAALLEKAIADKAKPDASREPKGSKIGGVSNAELGSISVKAPPLTVSSLREIGGGIAGETVTSQLDLAQVQVNLQERMLSELEKLNNKSGDSIDFTKPPSGLGLGQGVTLV